MSECNAEGGTRTPTVLLPPAPQAETSERRSKPTPEYRGRLSLIISDRRPVKPTAAVWLADSCEGSSARASISLAKAVSNGPRASQVGGDHVGGEGSGPRHLRWRTGFGRHAVAGRTGVGELQRVSLGFPAPPGNATVGSPRTRSQFGARRTNVRRPLQRAANGANRRFLRCRVGPDLTAQRGSPCFRANSSRNCSAGLVRPAFTSSRPWRIAWTASW